VQSGNQSASAASNRLPENTWPFPCPVYTATGVPKSNKSQKFLHKFLPNGLLLFVVENDPTAEEKASGIFASNFPLEKVPFSW
jgi:hypothetical protein